LDEQRSLFPNFEKLGRERGLGAVVDSWEADFDWLRGP